MVKSRPCSWFFLFLCLLVPVFLSAQILPFKTYSVIDGLLSNNVGTIYQDSRGYMWFGTTDGISVFDGKTYRNYTVQDGLPSNFISDIFEDRKTAAKMWILAGGHVCTLAGDTIHTYLLPISHVRSLYQDSAGVVWCAGDWAILQIDGDSVKQFSPDPLKQGALEVAGGGDSLVWFATLKNFFTYSRNTGALLSYDLPQYKDSALWALTTDREGDAWMGMGGGHVLRLRSDGLVQSQVMPVPTSTLTGDMPGLLWFGGYGGIGHISKKDFGNTPAVIYTEANGLPDNFVRSLYVDREQNVWVGGRDKGVSKLSSLHTARFPLGALPEFALAHGMRVAVSDSNSHIWVISGKTVSEFWRDTYGEWHSYGHALLTLPDTLISLFYDSKGKLWFGYGYWASQVQCYDVVPDASGQRPSELRLDRTVHLERDFKGRWPLQFIVDHTGVIWHSFGKVGIAQIDPARSPPLVHVYGEEEGVSTVYTRTLFEDKLGRIWGGGLSSGLKRLSPLESAEDAVKGYDAPGSLSVRNFWCIMEDRSGNILAGTGNNGLAIVSGDSIMTLTVKNGLPSNTIYCMTEDISGRLWIGTSIGMAYESSPGSRIFIQKKIFTGSAAHFCGTTRDGLIWWVTPTDLIVYDDNDGTGGGVSPPVYLTHFKVNGSPRVPAQIVELAHTENNFEIGFIGLSFIDEEAIQYRYRLAGADKNWTGPTYNTSITYGHLVPGSYTFEVKAINVDGVESIIPATLAIAILPPYWQTWWFYSLVGSIFIAVGPFVYWRRTRILQRERRAAEDFSRRLIESQEFERKRVAGELHDGLGQELIVIANRAQMALRGKTDEKVKEQIRGIADTAGLAIETVREIAFNLSPFHLEQLGLTESLKSMIARVCEASDIRFTVDIDIIDHLFPSGKEINIYRIVQECVNNILKHSRATAGSVSVKKYDHSVRITVQDNGRGFDASKRIRAGDREGYGLTGLAERIKVFKGTLRVDSTEGGGSVIHITLACPPGDTGIFRSAG